MTREEQEVLRHAADRLDEQAKRILAEAAMLRRLALFCGQPSPEGGYCELGRFHEGGHARIADIKTHPDNTERWA